MTDRHLGHENILSHMYMAAMILALVYPICRVISVAFAQHTGGRETPASKKSVCDCCRPRRKQCLHLQHHTGSILSPI